MKIPFLTKPSQREPEHTPERSVEPISATGTKQVAAVGPISSEVTPGIASVLDSWVGDASSSETVARHPRQPGPEPTPWTIAHYAQQGISGSPTSLPGRDRLEASFGQSLADVPVYQGPRAEAASQALNAEAYAYRGSIVLGGQADFHTVAEETAHVLQQRSGKMANSGPMTAVDSPLEQEASRAADTVASGGTIGSLTHGLAASTVARKPKKMPPAPQKAKKSKPERTVFVKGTFSNDNPDYFSGDVKKGTHKLLGSKKESDFEYFGGPNDATARRVAGRKLYKEQALPAAARDEKLNIVAHSHGGNVVGEMGAHMEQQEQYLGAVSAGAKSQRDSPEFKKGLQTLERRMEKLLAERQRVVNADWSVFNLQNSAHTNSGQKKTELLAYLDNEIAECEGHHAALLKGDDTEVAEELRLLQNLDIGDVIVMQTPYMAQHPEIDEQKMLMDKADGIHDFQNPNDPVVAAGHRISGDQGNRLLEGKKNPKVKEHEWTLGASEGPAVNPNPDLRGGLLDPRGRAQHGATTDNKQVFDRHIADPIKKSGLANRGN